MKYHIKIFLISLALIVAGLFLSKSIELTLTDSLLAQAEAISYIVTLVGTVVAFSWYNRSATPTTNSTEIPIENIKKQNKVLNYLLIISVINSLIILVNNDKPSQMMALIGLMVIIISPVIFRTMQEKETNTIGENTEDKNETNA